MLSIRKFRITVVVSNPILK